MKAATRPPDASVVQDASIAIDVLLQDLDAWQKAPLSQRNTYPVHADEIGELLQRVDRAALAEYLRRFPNARAGDVFVSAHNKETREWDVVCVFCRADLNTYASGGSPPAAFWIPIRLHGQICGARMLAGELAPAGPGGARGEVQKPVTKLRGNALIAAAKEAAEYLTEATGSPVPVPSARADRSGGGGIAGKGRAKQLRALVSEARAIKRNRARGVG
ncbi:MAG TPA: hypothetical protein VFD36_29415 [Kofleriaceae bacterium]|nr:hypothetical protein [Kofleriaceae bacterium]